MTNEPLAYIKKSYPFSQTSQEHEIHHAYITGSVARGVFYPGWSDIDIVIVFQQTPSIDTLVTLNEWQKDLTALFKCKVGLDYLDLRLINDALIDRSLLEFNLASMQNYFGSNRSFLEKGLLYGDIDTIPVIAMHYLLNIDLRNGLESLKESIYETVMRAPEEGLSLPSYRILVKFTLYAGQFLILRDFGVFISDYRELIQKLGTYPAIDVTTIRGVLDHLNSRVDNHITFTSTDVARTLECFAQITSVCETENNL